MSRTDRHDMNFTTGLDESVRDRGGPCATNEDDDDMAETMVKKEDEQLTMRSVKVLRASIGRKHFRLRRGEVKSSAKAIMEEHGYSCSVRRSEYYDPLDN